MKISLIVPAYNEGKYLGATLESIGRGLSELDCPSEVIVVDNDSTDATENIAIASGARVVLESVHNIARVRNAGAGEASGDILVFVDADTLLPQGLMQEIAESLEDVTCFGGAAAVEWEGLTRSWVRYYLLGWKFWERFLNTKQGATQYCRKAAFDAIGGFSEDIFVGEDVEFYWRLAKYARKQGGSLNFITNPKVKTSARRFNEMSAWRLLVRTNPIFIRLNWRRKDAWQDWYEKAIR